MYSCNIYSLLCLAPLPPIEYGSAQPTKCWQIMCPNLYQRPKALPTSQSQGCACGHDTDVIRRIASQMT